MNLVVSDTSETFFLKGSGDRYKKEYKDFLQQCKCEFRDKIETPIDTCEMKDFTLVQSLASGTFGLVLLVKYNKTGSYHAMKVIPKNMLVSINKIAYAKSEKTILHGIRFPFSVHLDYFFQDNSYIYFIMPFISGGEMFTLIQKLGKFTEVQSRFYAAQVVLVIEYLHFLGLIYRDLKPENILIDHRGYLKVTDFGMSKFVRTRTWTMCGTPEYIAPEIYLQKGYGKAVDWWALGVLIYEMSFGSTPFFSHQYENIYKNIVTNYYKFPNSFSFELKDIISNLLQLDLSRRYGNLRNGANDIKDHKWFRQIEWLSLFNKNLEPPFVPKVENPADTSNFLSHPKPDLIISKEDTYASQFLDF